MTTVPRWFDRKFEFVFPVEQFPNLCARLRGTPARLEEIARSPSREALVRKPNSKWSAQEHAGHLLNLESLWLARVEDFLKDGSALTVADLKNTKTHEANHNAGPIDTILSEFRRAREELVQRAESLDPTAISRTKLHPRLKQPMRLVDHLFFAAEHDDHHLAMIWQMTR